MSQNMTFGESKSLFVNLLMQGLKCNLMLIICLENEGAQIKQEKHSEDGEFKGTFLFKIKLTSLEASFSSIPVIILNVLALAQSPIICFFLKILEN